MKDVIQKKYPEMSKALLLEELSTDTLQNAYFSKIIHVDSLNIKELCIVTNSFHIPRAKQIFTHLYDDTYELEFFDAEDPKVDQKTQSNYKFIEKTLTEFNQNTLFNKNVSDNLKNTHSFIFSSNFVIKRKYNELISALQPYFTYNPNQEE